MDQPRTLSRDASPAGDRVAYRITPGPPAADTGVLLLHGLASNLTRWSEFVAVTSLAERHPLIRVDLRGHGDSPTRRRIGLELWSDDLAALMDAERLRRAIVVGHSLGAQAALHFASVHAARARALVLIDPVFRAALHGKWKRIATCGPLFALAAAAVRALNALGLRRRHVTPLDLQQLDREARVALADARSEAAFVRRYSSTRSDLRSFRVAHYLQELVELFRPLPPPSDYPMPVLVLLSTGATFATLAETRALAAGFPRGEIDTIDCHHWPLTERPAEVRARIERWIAALPPG